MKWALLLWVALLASCTVASERPSSTLSPAAEAPAVPASPTPSLSPTSPWSLSASPPSPSTATPTPVLGAFDPARALEVAARLAAAGPRPAGTAADRAARFEIAMALWAAGWDVREDVIALPQGGETANVVATMGDPEDGPHVVIGAHHDTVVGSPGANDNGSGVGVLVALAEELADEAAALPVPLVLVAFGAEEYQPSTPRQHHVGSEVHAANPLADVVAMISIDMVGHGETLCVCWFSAGPAALAERLHTVADDEGIERVEVRSVPDWSDHGPFARRGVPAVLLWAGDAPGYHGPGDTADLLELDDLERTGQLVLAFVRRLTPADREGLG